MSVQIEFSVQINLLFIKHILLKITELRLHQALTTVKAFQDTHANMRLSVDGYNKNKSMTE